MKMFMTENQTKKTISDLIMEKIKEKEIQLQNPEALESKLDPKIVSVYSQVGKILQRYTSGRLPKAAKIIPMLTNWEEVLYLTNPDKWSSQSVRCLTKIFASNLQDKMAERYYNLVLLPHFRSDLETKKKLNWHLYMALKKALYKPRAFYKGILIPLCEAADCSLREATILGSIIKKVSIPALPSSIAIMKIALLPYSGGNSMFLKVLIEKKYALPLPVINCLVEHFLKFKSETRVLPVLWHQSLLSFAQIFKTDITAEQKNELKLLLRIHSHHKITPEIRRELFQSKCRDDENATDMDVDMSETQ
jgi:essential nuclear protein 1